MTVNCKTLLITGVIAGCFLNLNAVAASQAPPPAPSSTQGSTQGTTPGTAQTPPAAADKDKAKNSMSLDDPATPPVSAEENAALKAIADLPPTERAKKIELGEAFIAKYPNSRYLPGVYSTLTVAYLQDGKVPKMVETGEKAIALNPNDVQTLALLGQTIPRSMNASSPEPDKQLAKAEQYSRKAIDLTPTLPKPENIDDAAFSNAKNQTLAMAHSGLGLVYVRRGKFSDAIPELNQSVTIDPTPDPVNYYLLGIANQKSSHFDDATAAYNKCAAMPGSMQQTCQKGAEESKKLGATQLTAPK